MTLANHRAIPQQTRQVAQNELGCQPRYDFSHVIDRLQAGHDLQTPLAQLIGSRGYHDDTFTDGPYPVGERPDPA